MEEFLGHQADELELLLKEELVAVETGNFIL